VAPLGRAGQSQAPLSCAAQGRHASRVASARTLGLEVMRRGSSASLLPVSVRQQRHARSAAAVRNRGSEASPRQRRQESTAALRGSPRLSDLGKWAAGSLSGKAAQRRRSAARGASCLSPSPRCGFAFASRPNPSLNTRPSAAGRLAREALVVYAAPRGQGVRPLRAR